MAVDPRGAGLKRMLAEDPVGPMVMLNLLRFRPGGRVSYEEYARQLAVTFLPRYGARVIYAGTGSIALVAEQGQAWDAVLLVRYPSWEAFSWMAAGPEYQQVTHLRTGALTEAVLQATVPWETPPWADAAQSPGAGRPAGPWLSQTNRRGNPAAAGDGRGCGVASRAAVPVHLTCTRE